jgi:hypothetical protein
MGSSHCVTHATDPTRSKGTAGLPDRRNQAEIRPHVLATLEPMRVLDRCVEGQCADWSNTRYAEKALANLYVLSPPRQPSIRAFQGLSKRYQDLNNRLDHIADVDPITSEPVKFLIDQSFQVQTGKWRGEFPSV